MPNGWLIAVLPPTEESTWDNSVVGTWINLIPRWYADAAKPATSPITPPPKAISMLLRV